MKLTSKMLLIVILCFIISCANKNSHRQDYLLFINSNHNHEFIYNGCVLMNKSTLDTISKLTLFCNEYNNNCHIFYDHLYSFSQLYHVYSPTSDLTVAKFQILKDTLLFVKNYDLGNYNRIDSVSSIFEDSKLTLFKGDSIIEFDLEQWLVIGRYVK